MAATAAHPARTPPGALFVRAPGGRATSHADASTSSVTPPVDPPPPGPPAPNLLVLLHGAGDAPAPYARLATKLALPDTAALALRGPFTLGPGYNWFGETPSDEADAACLAAARPALAAAIDGAGWPRHRVHLFGYGDGGAAVLDLCMAATAGSLGAGPPGSAASGRRWGSAVTVGATLLPAQAAALAEAPAAGVSAPITRPTPILMTRGEGEDLGAPADLAAATVATLQQAGLAEARLLTVAGKAGEMLGPVQAEVEAVMAHWGRCLAAAAPAGCEEVAGC